MENTKGRKRTFAIIAVVVCLALAAVGGTIAWLTAANKVTNTFTVGEITQPDDGNDDGVPDNPPDEPEGEDEHAKLDGNIYEITDELIIIPGSDSLKKPWIGIGPGSEDAYVFAYVDNNMMSKTAEPGESSYFVLNEGWVPVGDQSKYAVAGVANAYTGGLFAWCGDNGVNPTPLVADETQNVWTSSPVFDNVIHANDPNDPTATTASDYNENASMDVWCFIYADVNDTTFSDAIDAANAWANAENGPAVIAGEAAANQGN